MFQSINPATEVLTAEYDFISNAELEMKLDTALSAFLSWKAKSFAERAEPMLKAAAYLESHKEPFGTTISLEMGKPLSQAIAEIEKSAFCCRYFAQHAEKFLAAKIYDTDYSTSFVNYEPLGIIYAIMPWNFPFWQVIRCAAPALMAGNVVVLKHAENVPQCAGLLEKTFAESGFPEGVFTNLFITHEQSDKVIEYTGVKGISLTGSGRAGSHVSAQSGKNMKKTVLELGGSDPFIILHDADLAAAADTGVKSRFQNNGQSCIAAKRFIVDKRVADRFLELFLYRIKNLTIGYPLDKNVDLGPLARRDLAETLDRQVKNTVSKGGEILLEGGPMEGKGFYYRPAVLTRIPENSAAYTDELFGPVASVFIVDDEAEALAIANGNTFGLGASLWTQDLKKAKELSAHIDAGCVYINTMVKSDPRIPFGGIKSSGYGRELSDAGIQEFVNFKTVCIQ